MKEFVQLTGAIGVLAPNDDAPMFGVAHLDLVTSEPAYADTEFGIERRVVLEPLRFSVSRKRLRALINGLCRVEAEMMAFEDRLTLAPESASPPAGFRELPNGLICKCPRCWTDGSGKYWCCIPEDRVANTGTA